MMSSIRKNNLNDDILFLEPLQNFEITLNGIAPHNQGESRI
jgi:hypothetical protein